MNIFSKNNYADENCKYRQEQSNNKHYLFYWENRNSDFYNLKDLCISIRYFNHYVILIIK